jgi:hypothetical protein
MLELHSGIVAIIGAEYGAGRGLYEGAVATGQKSDMAREISGTLSLVLGELRKGCFI